MLTRPEKIIGSVPRRLTPRHGPTQIAPLIAGFDRRFPDTILYTETGLIMSQKLQSPRLNGPLIGVRDLVLAFRTILSPSAKSFTK